MLRRGQFSTSQTMRSDSTKESLHCSPDRLEFSAPSNAELFTTIPLAGYVMTMRSLFILGAVVGLAFVACSENESPNTTAVGGDSTSGDGSTTTVSEAASTTGDEVPSSSEGDTVGDPQVTAEAGPSSAEGANDSTGAEDSSGGSTGSSADDMSMSFFVTSRGSGTGGDFGGIAGADAFCTELATAVSAELGAKTWRAYLSTSTENARDRIGTGPWYNAAGVLVATNVDQLHDQAAGGTLETTWGLGDDTIALDETGTGVPNQPVTHDIVTGSNIDGTVAASGTCSDWTSDQGTTQNGHSNRAGGGATPTSWNSSHGTGCGEPDPGANFQQGTVSQGGGRGSIYCFAID